MDPFDADVARTWPPTQWREVTVLVGVSGGPDSVALTRSLAHLKGDGPGRLVVAHFEHGWRPEAQLGDRQFVEELAAKLDLPFVSGAATGEGIPSGTGLEAAARVERFRFFDEVAQRYGARYLALGHTRDDHIETILQRILRGTGPRGLAGIPVARAWREGAAIVHPLRNLRRCDVIAYLERLGQDYRRDETNEDLSRTRNRIRQRLLPLLREEFSPHVDEALLRLSEWAELYEHWVPHVLEPLWKKAITIPVPRRVVVRCEELAAEPRLAVLELLRQVWDDRDWPQQSMDAPTWHRLADMVLAPDDSVAMLPGGVRAERREGLLVLERLPREA